MNCCIEDFKESLCDCNNGICKEYKKVGRSEDFENEVLKRTKTRTAEWIPCSERLPEHGDDVLVTYSDGEVSIVMGARSKYWMKWKARENSNLIFPIAWMPLPKPYREDGEV